MGTLLGIIVGISINNLYLKKVFLLFNDTIRAIPMLVMIFFVYYFPFKQIFGISPPNALYSSIIAMSITQAAYTADIVHSAFLNVSRRTIMGAKALGLTERTILYYIKLPDIIRQILPAEIAFFIGIIRLSSLASVIGASEIVFVARTSITQNFRSLEAWIIVALIYIIMVLPITYFARKFENSKWIKRKW
ncbi:MAG: hypothetical protein A2W85_10290 [Bacteroidetes bacterium GWF2_41_31]|nr:MAG: hypothetical protein A2W85_10290 [Bacteroidetes bacterium GWF2_41_31]